MLRNHYREPNVLNNDFDNDRVPLQLNCTGLHTFPHAISHHSVRKDYYLFYLNKGSIQLLSPVQAILREGDLIVFDRNIPFSYRTHGKAPTSHYFAHFTGYAAPSLLKTCGLTPGAVYSIPGKETLILAFEALFRACLVRDTMFDLDTAQHLTALLVTVGRLLTADERIPVQHARQRLKVTPDYIHANFTKDISVKELAKMEYLSESRYRALFSSAMKQSPHEYICALRLQAACDMLAHSELSIQQIAEAVGYPDGQYFSRLFRKKYGLPPSQYRQKLYLPDPKKE